MALPERAVAENNVGVVDIVDHLLNRGAVVDGNCTLSIAGVDLVYLKLRLLLSSVATLETLEESPNRSGAYGHGFPPSRERREERAEGRNTIMTTLPASERQTPPSGRSLEPLSATELQAREGLATPVGAGALDRPVALEEDQGQAGKGLAQLVLTIIELLRQLMERQALRRVEAGGLSEEQIEKVGLSLRELEAKMVELREIFDLKESEINLDLGPLGRLLG